MPADRRHRATAILIWAAYFIVPNDAGGLIDGIAAGPLEAAALLAIGWLAFYGARLPLASTAAVVLLVSTVAGAAIPGTPGLRARYFANEAGTGEPERSAEFIRANFTRIDTRLHFAPGGPELPLNFFNDNTRYSLFQVAYIRHDQLPFSVRWGGEWWVDDRIDAIYVQTGKATGEIFIDGAPAAVVPADDDDGESVVSVPLGAGWHRLDVSLSAPYGAARRFSAGTVRNGTRRPFQSSEIFTQRIRPWQVTSARLLALAKGVFDAIALVIVGAIFAASLWRTASALWSRATDAERRRQAIAVFWAVAAADAWRFARPWADRVMLLVAGDDTATYETFARDILFNGLLMSGGKPLGHGEPFYYQAFYPYFLALEHIIGGEFMFGVVLIQRLLAIYAIVTLVDITIRFTAERAWIVALPMAAGFVWWKFSTIAAQPLNESLYVPLIVGAVAAMVRLCDAPRPRRATWAGAIGGLASITRSTALPAWLLALLMVRLNLRDHPGRHRVLILAIASFVTVFSLIAIRNWIVAGVFAPTPTEMGITLRGGNEPPPGLVLDPNRAATYQRFGLDDHTAVVLDYAIQQPGAFAANIGRKFWFVLGFYEPYAPGWGYSPVYIATWVSAMAGLWLTIGNRSGQIWPLLIPAIVSVVQLAAIVVIYPKGERLVLPVYVVLIPYSAAAVWFVLNRRSSEAANVSLIASRTST